VSSGSCVLRLSGLRYGAGKSILCRDRCDLEANKNTVASEAGKSRLSLVDSSIYVSA